MPRENALAGKTTDTARTIVLACQLHAKDEAPAQWAVPRLALLDALAAARSPTGPPQVFNVGQSSLPIQIGLLSSLDALGEYIG